MNFFGKILERRSSKKELLFIDRQYIVFSYLHEFVKEKTKKSKITKYSKLTESFTDGVYLSSVSGTLTQILIFFHNKKFSENTRTVKLQQARVCNIQFFYDQRIN